MQDVGKAQISDVTKPTCNMIKGKMSNRSQKKGVCFSKVKCLEIQKLVVEEMVSQKSPKHQ